MKLKSITTAILLFNLGCGAESDLPREGDIVQRAEICIEMGSEYCIKVTDCGLVPELGACETEFVNSCCVDSGLCGQQVQLARDLQPCIDIINDMSCQEHAGAQAPPIECTGII